MNVLPSRRRPVYISVIAGFLFAATLIAIVVGTSLLIPGTILDRMWELNRPAYSAFAFRPTASGLLFLLLSLCTAYAAVGLLNGVRKARWLAIALFTVNGTGDVVNLVRPANRLGGAVGIIIAATVLFYLIRPGAAAFFDKDRA